MHFCLQKNVSGAFCLWVCVVVASCLCGCSFLFDGPAAAAEIFLGHISKIPQISVEEPVKRGGKRGSDNYFWVTGTREWVFVHVLPNDFSEKNLQRLIFEVQRRFPCPIECVGVCVCVFQGLFCVCVFSVILFGHHFIIIFFSED